MFSSIGGLVSVPKIGFQLLSDDAWRFGIIYLMDLFYAVEQTYTSREALFCLFHNVQQSVPAELGSAVNEVLCYSPPTKFGRTWLMDRTVKRLLRCDLDLAQVLFLRRHRVQVVVSGQLLPFGPMIPMLSLIPDFQHVCLPEMFSVKERQIRDELYNAMAERSARVLLFSESVKADFERFAPSFAHKARVLKPVSCVPSSVYQDNPQQLSDFYHLPCKFVYLPNQFWKHKNHGVVFRAMRKLKEKGTEIFLVCSGYPGDDRHPMYFAGLLQELAISGIRNQVAFLGLLPREHVFKLMRQSVCVINPSLFEGYGMTVDEARSLGKQLLVSDLPSHHEQNLPQAIFFDPHDSADLAEKLNQVWNEKSPGPDLDLEEEACSALPARVTKYAESFMSVVQEVVVGATRL